MPDYVIVGAGSAGCTLAARLSEAPDVSVTLIEAEVLVLLAASRATAVKVWLPMEAVAVFHVAE